MGYLPSAILGSSRVFPFFSFPHCNTRAHLARGEVHPQKFFRSLQIFVDPLRFGLVRVLSIRQEKIQTAAAHRDVDEGVQKGGDKN